MVLSFILTETTTSTVSLTYLSSFSSRVASNLALKGVLFAEAFPTFEVTEAFSLVADGLFERVLLADYLVAD